MKEQTKTTLSADETLLTIARNMFRDGAPRELWAAVLCEAYGADHNLPRTPSQLRLAQEFDLATTRETIAKKGA